MTENQSNDSGGTDSDEVTQGENPGAQGDFGAGQGDPGLNDPVVSEPKVEGDEQRRRDDGDDDVENYVDRDPGEDATSVNGGNADR